MQNFILKSLNFISNHVPTLLGFPASWYISDCCSKKIEYICIDTIIRVSNEWDYVYVFKKKNWT